MVANEVSEFFSKRLRPSRADADSRRFALSVWLLMALAALAWTAIVATGLLVRDLIN